MFINISEPSENKFEKIILFTVASKILKQKDKGKNGIECPRMGQRLQLILLKKFKFGIFKELQINETEMGNLM